MMPGSHAIQHGRFSQRELHADEEPRLPGHHINDCQMRLYMSFRQYAAGDYRDILQAAAIVPSMSRRGNCWDNAPMESFFGTLKTELVHLSEYPNRDAARRDLPISKATTIASGVTPPSATLPPNGQRQNPRNPVSTFPGEGHRHFLRKRKRRAAVDGAIRWPRFGRPRWCLC
jgi:transposase InsO family protein